MTTRRLLLLALPLCVGATPFELPPEEPEGAWAEVLALSGFAPGVGSGAQPWVRVVRTADGRVTLEVHDEAGELRRSTGHPWPSTEAERRALVVKARALTRHDPDLPPILLPAARPEPEAPPRRTAPTPSPEAAPEPEPEPTPPGLFLDGAFDGLLPSAIPRTDPLYPSNPVHDCFCRAAWRDEAGHVVVETRFTFDDAGQCVCTPPAVPPEIEGPGLLQGDRRNRFW